METEDQILADMRMLFGEPLSALLLSGLGKEEVVDRRAFLATVWNSSDGLHKRYIEIRGDSVLGLPNKKEPLIWATLLLMFFDTYRPASNFSCQHTKILEILNWPDTTESRETIERALLKYAHLTYLQIKVRPQNQIPGSNLYQHITTQSPLIDCELSQEMRQNNQTDESLLIKLEFNPLFIGNLRHKWLFNGEWRSIEEIEVINWNQSMEEVNNMFASDNQA